MAVVNVQKIVPMENPSGIKEIREIRRKVYIIGQSCPEDVEWEYEDESTFFLASIDGKSCGCSRWRMTESGYKLERFAVLEEYRKRGVAKALMIATLADLPSDADCIYLNAQVTAMGLYSQFGFVAEGDAFDEAGIQHFKMVKRN